VRVSDQRLFLLAALPPSKWQIGLALGVVVALVVAFGITMPFVASPLPRIDAFIPALETAIVIADTTTSALLFAQFSIVPRLALLVLASGYLLTGLIVVPHALSFPGAFAPTGLLGGGAQSTAWLYHLWKVTLPTAVIVYVFLKDADIERDMPQRPPATVIGWSVAAVILIAFGLTWLATAGEWLPRIGVTVSRHFVGALDISLTAVALALLGLRRRSVLDLWLMVMCSTLLLELAMAIIFTDTRYSLGFYASRLYSLIATLFVLLVLLSETTILYAHLARSMMRQRGEREARQTAMDAMAASIVHEMKQPLGAMVANGNAGLRWLARSPPDLAEVSAALKRIVNDGHRASEVITSIRSMLKKDVHGRTSLDMNDLVKDVLKMIELDLRIQGVSVATELRDGLPQLLADRGQLRQVLLNLIMNAIEAMDSVTDRARLMRVTSDVMPKSPGVLLTIEDFGPGIDQKDIERIFEPFYTTKSQGMGMGLSICRSIVEAHGGRLIAEPGRLHGLVFRVSLPIDGRVGQ
jgi:signal transduction histidine kinase